MPQRHLESFLRCLRRWAGAEGALGLTDGQLLERFVNRREDSAFEAIVRSHGPMVFGLCRRLLNNAHDAEDAFQATFLVLARKASSISKRESVGSWLFGVAYRIAARERSRQAQRRYAEREMSTVPCRSMGSGGDAAENWTILSEELSRLPEKYRAPLVLHYLEGKTKDEAAQQLGWPEGTVSGRLARGRAMLRGRLVKRGLTVSAALIASGFAGNEVLATVPQTLLGAVLQNASLSVTGKVASASAISPKVLALAEGVQKAMLLTKIKIVAAFLMAASLIFVGTVWTVAALPAGQPDEKRAPALKPEAKQTQKPKGDLEKIQGAWNPILAQSWGQEFSKEHLAREEKRYLIKGNNLVSRSKYQMLEGVLKLDPSANPKTIDLMFGEGFKVWTGIYAFEGDNLKICVAYGGRPRPLKFSAGKEDGGDWIEILERQRTD